MQHSVFLAVALVAFSSLSLAQRAPLSVTNVDDPYIGHAPTEWLLDDFDGDGDRDIIYAGASPASMHSVVNDAGDFLLDVYQFPSALQDLGSQGLAAMTQFDFDLDGDQDLFLSVPGPDRKVLRNDGSGDFSTAPVISVDPFGLESTGLVAGDVNSDGLPDVLGFNRTRRGVVYFNVGGNSFSSISPSITGLTAGWEGAVMGDVDLDGDLDVVTRSRSLTNSTSRQFLNDGTGLFTGSVEIDSPAFALADMNVDGDLDLVSWNRVFENLGNATYTPGPDMPLSSLTVVSDLVVGDVDHDGLPDLFMAFESNVEPGERRLMLNDGLGGFLAAPGFTETFTAMDGALAIDDWTGDGHTDLLIGTPTQLEVHRGNGTGAFWRRSAQLGSLGVRARSITVGRFNYDAFPDLYMIARVPGMAPMDLTVFGFLQADGSVELQIRLFGSNHEPFLLTDLDGDGLDDLIFGGVGFRARLSAGGSYPDSLQQFQVPHNSVSALAAGDFDGDGDHDLIGVSQNSTQLLLNNGLGGLLNESQLVPDLPGNGVQVGDFDADGDLDAFVSDLNSRILINDGTATFSVGPSLLLGELATNPMVADIEGDGDLDILVHLDAPSRQVLLLNSGALSFVPVEFAPGTPPARAFVDLDGDGIQELLLESGAAIAAIYYWSGSTYALASGVESQFPLSTLSNLVVVDTDGDGDEDIVGVREDPGPFFRPRFPVVFNNLSRHLEATKPARLGRVAELTVFGVESTPWLLGAAFSKAELPLGSAGTLYLPVPGMTILGQGTFSALGVAQVNVPVPNVPALADVDVYLQAVIGFAPNSLSNLVKVTLVDF